jgi:hypothetical protein
LYNLLYKKVRAYYRAASCFVFFFQANSCEFTCEKV